MAARCRNFLWSVWRMAGKFGNTNITGYRFFSFTNKSFSKKLCLSKIALAGHFGVWGYTSRHWAEAVAVHLRYENESTSKLQDIGNTWAQKTVSLLWEFSREMWEDHNKCLHDSSSEDYQKMKGAAVNVEMQRLYNNITSYAAEDRWHFDLPLALQLKKPLHSRQRG